MAALASTTRQANQRSRRSVAKTGPRPTAGPGCTSRSALSPSTAHQLQLAHRTAMPAVTKSRSSARTSAASASYNSMLHCYKPASLFSSHSSLITGHCFFNRQLCRLEITVTQTKQTPATPINRQLSSTLRPTNHESQITNYVSPNRHTPRLEIAKKPTKSQFLAVLIVTFSRFLRAQFAERGPTGSKGQKLPSRYKWTVALEQEIAQLIENKESSQFLFDTNEQASPRRMSLCIAGFTNHQLRITNHGSPSPIAPFLRTKFHAGLSRRIS